MARPLVLVVVSACYAPSVTPGSPCDPGPCPAELVCQMASHTCQPLAVDAPADGTATADGASVPFLAGYAHRKRLTIAATASDLVDFPVSVLETGDPELASAALADGTDIVFTSRDGTSILASELVSYSPSNGGLEAWVRTSLTPIPTTVFMYYGGPSHSAPTPWSAVFAGVWHMGGTASTAPDSSPHHHDAMAMSPPQQPAISAGVVGSARTFDGLITNLSVGDPVDGSLDFGTGSFSYSVWVSVAQSMGAYDMPLAKGGTSAGDTGYEVELGTGVWHAGTSDGLHVITGALGSEVLGRWAQLAAVVDRATGKLETYVDGSSSGSADIAMLGSVGSLKPLEMSPLNFPFRGQLDEVRIYSVAVSAAWIAAEHQNLATRSQFVTIGAAETP